MCSPDVPAITDSESGFEGTPLEITYRNSVADSFRFNIYTLPRQRSIQILYTAVIVILSYVIWSSVQRTDESLAMKITVFFVSMAVAIGITASINLIGVYLSVVLTKSRQLICEHHIVLDETGIEERTSLGRQETKWQGVHRVVRTKKLVLLYISPVAAHLVPTSAFESADDLDRFVDFAVRMASGAQDMV